MKAYIKARHPIIIKVQATVGLFTSSFKVVEGESAVMEYIKFWKETLSDFRTHGENHTVALSTSTRFNEPATNIFIMPCLLFVPLAGILHLLSAAYTVTKGWKTTNRRIAASTT